jgi:hypothetical protein
MDQTHLPQAAFDYRLRTDTVFAMRTTQGVALLQMVFAPSPALQDLRSAYAGQKLKTEDQLSGAFGCCQSGLEMTPDFSENTMVSPWKFDMGRLNPTS